MYHARIHEMYESNEHGEDHSINADPHTIEPIRPKNWVETAVEGVHYCCCMDQKLEV
jgi:hypothetical protein